MARPRRRRQTAVRYVASASVRRGYRRRLLRVGGVARSAAAVGKTVAVAALEAARLGGRKTSGTARRLAEGNGVASLAVIGVVARFYPVAVGFSAA